MDIDTTQIESYDELIEIARGLSSDQERMQLLGKYFMENVTYAYEFVDILGQSKNYDQQVLMEIQEKYDVWNPEERAKALLEVRAYLEKEMAKRFHSKELLEQTLEIRMQAISEQYGRIFEATNEKNGVESGKIRISQRVFPKRIANLVGVIGENGEVWNSNLSHNHSEERGAMQAYEPYEIWENGLLKNAVCQEYAPWIKKYCDDLGIPCEMVEGKGTVEHAWALIRFGTDEPIHFDPTNMAFIRDGYGENPTNAKPEEWLGVDIAKMFRMQPGREIYGIGDTKGLLITSKNYEENREAINQMIGYDYSAYNSYEEFIAAAKQITSQEEQIRFVCEYFEKNVEYDYRTLFNALCTYGVSRVYPKISDLKKETFQAQLLKEVLTDVEKPIVKLSRIINSDGENPILSQLIELNNSENPESNFIDSESVEAYALRIWEEIMLPEIQKHTTNQEIIDECYQEYLQYVTKSIGTSIVGIQDENKKMCGACFNDVANILVNNMGQIDKRHPCKGTKGLITKGVCKHHAEFLKKVLDELGIENALVGGISECNHAWNVVRINGKFKYIDTTREAFIRDGYGNIPEREAGKWILCDAKDMFEMQKGRMIYEIGDTKLDIGITSDNYEEMQEVIETAFEETVKQQDEPETSLGQIAEQVLRAGMDMKSCDNAIKQEKPQIKEAPVQ